MDKFVLYCHFWIVCFSDIKPVPHLQPPLDHPLISLAHSMNQSLNAHFDLTLSLVTKQLHSSVPLCVMSPTQCWALCSQ